MSDKPLALSTITPHPDADYEAMRARMLATPHGRWFLDEFARRTGNTERTPDATDRSSDAFAVAERLADLSWTMRERGLEVAACGQIEELTRIILQASSLRDPGDHRAQKLGDVLRLLEARLETMLASTTPAAAPIARVPTPAEPEPAEFLLEPISHPPPIETATERPEDIESDLFANPSVGSAALDDERDVELEVEPEADLQAQLERQLAIELEFEPVPLTRAVGPASPSPRASMQQAAPTPPLPTPRALLTDPLASLRAMSDEERIALFT